MLKELLKKLFKNLLNNRGEIGADGIDPLATEAYAEQDEERLAEKEGRQPRDLSKPDDDQKDEKESKDENIDNEEEQEENQEEESEEEQTDEGTDKSEKKSEEESETEEPEEEDLDAKIEKHAEKQEMTYAEAKEDIEKTDKIIEQFKNDPAEMARALRSKDREYDKLNTKLEQVKSTPKVPEDLTEEQYLFAAKQKFQEDPEKYVGIYKKKYPARGEELSEAAILEEVAEKSYEVYKVNVKNLRAENGVKAVKARELIVSEIKDADKRFIPEVKAMLSEMPDSDIVAEGASFGYLIDIAKGKKFDEEIKAAEERGFKRAKEGAKILGVKKNPKSTKPGSSKKEATTVSLNEEQKHRAEQMFSSADYTPEEAYKLFAETYESELKKNPRYI